jgi:hypothetical protein
MSNDINAVDLMDQSDEDEQYSSLNLPSPIKPVLVGFGFRFDVTRGFGFFLSLYFLRPIKVSGSLS